MAVLQTHLTTEATLDPAHPIHSLAPNVCKIHFRLELQRSFYSACKGSCLLGRDAVQVSAGLLSPSLVEHSGSTVCLNPDHKQVPRLSTHGITFQTLTSVSHTFAMQSLPFRLSYLNITQARYRGPRQLSRYSDLLRAGRSGHRIPVGARFSAPVQTGRGAHPASCKMATGSFPGVKRPGRGVDHPPPTSAEVKERAEIYLYSPSGPSWLVLG